MYYEENSSFDWAKGFIKLECPDGELLQGLGLKGLHDGTSILCAKPNNMVLSTTNCQTRYFNHSDNIIDKFNAYDDFAPEMYKLIITPLIYDKEPYKARFFTIRISYKL